MVIIQFKCSQNIAPLSKIERNSSFKLSNLGTFLYTHFYHVLASEKEFLGHQRITVMFICSVHLKKRQAVWNLIGSCD